MTANQTITAYAIIGTMNALCSPPESARRPASGGNRAPPMIAMQSTPEVDSREALERSSVTVKMTGNMIELKNPTDSAATAATEPCPCMTVRQRTDSHDGGAGQHARRRQPGQQQAAGESPDHRAAPIEKPEQGAGPRERNAEDVRLVQEVDHQAGDRDLGTHVREDGGRTEDCPLRAQRRGDTRPAAGLALHARESVADAPKEYRQQRQHDGDRDIGDVDVAERLAAAACGLDFRPNTPPRSISAAPSQGPSTVPSELKACVNVRRKCAREGGPSDATSGLAVTCSKVMPLAMMKSETRTTA